LAVDDGFSTVRVATISRESQDFFHRIVPWPHDRGRIIGGAITNDQHDSAISVKLLVAASAGGHANDLTALLQRAEELWPVKPSVYVTTAKTQADRVRDTGMRLYVVREADRRTPISALVAFVQTFRVISRERPDAIVTTGAMPMAIMCIWGRLFGAKIAWIDCLSQVDTLSLSGRVTRRLAHLTLTQWPDVATRFRRVEYAGEVL
jgi:UDP-N-acetylglucosamine:LPS N-acetylglucosamine transferase